MAVPDAPDADQDHPRRLGTEGRAREVVRQWLDQLQRRHPDWDATRMLLVCAAVIAVCGMAWTVLSHRPGSGAAASLAVQNGAPTTSLVLGPYAPNATDPPTTSAAPTTVIVDVEGAVRTPGIVQVPAPGRVADAIDAAGGTTADADVVRINRAAPVADGQRIYVPRVGEDQPPSVIGPDPGASGNPGASQPPDALINLNAATAQELETLPGVGPATAQAIVEHRTANGKFASVDDLLDVRGIGEAKLAALRNKVTV